jgi:hypothetical protein
MAFSTRARVSERTPSKPLRIRDTVRTETPARFATSLIECTKWSPLLICLTIDILISECNKTKNSRAQGTRFTAIGFALVQA